MAIPYPRALDSQPLKVIPCTLQRDGALKEEDERLLKANISYTSGTKSDKQASAPAGGVIVHLAGDPLADLEKGTPFVLLKTGGLVFQLTSFKRVRDEAGSVHHTRMEGKAYAG